MERSGTHDHASSTSQSFTAPFRLASCTRSRALSPTLLALPHLLLTVAVAILCSSLANASWDGINEFTVVTASTGAATTTERTVSVTGTGSCQCKLLSSACVVNCYCDSNCSCKLFYSILEITYDLPCSLPLQISFPPGPGPTVLPSLPHP